MRPLNHAAVVSLLTVVIMLAAACTTSVTVDDSTASDSSTAVAAEPTPTAAPATAVVEPTPVPVDPALIVPQGDPADFRADALMAISTDGSFAYAGTTSVWNSPTPCSNAATESLAVVSIAASVAGDVAPVGAGLEQVGDVRQVLFGANRRMAIISSCGPFGDGEVWLQHGVVGDDGLLQQVSAPMPLAAAANETSFHLTRWLNEASVEIDVIIEVDPDDFDSWVVETRAIDLATSEVTSATQSSLYGGDEQAGPLTLLETADGFTYRSVDDPGGALGCEGYGVARTIEVAADGTNFRLALGVDGLVLSSVNDLQIAATGHVSWTSGCEGFTSVYVGKVLPDGTIIDAHFVDPNTSRSGDFVDYQLFRLTNDGYLVGVGQTFETDGNEPGAAFLRYDLATDPHFVNSAVPPVPIDEEPLFVAIDGVSTWHLGKTLSEQRKCGGRTLYGKTSTGFVRAFPAGIEIDEIVDVDLAEIRRMSFDDGTEYVSRTVVVQTECPARYEGRRIWFGTESESVQWGLVFERADILEVADVRRVRDLFEDGSQFLDLSMVEIELLDGTVFETELFPLAGG